MSRVKEVCIEVRRPFCSGEWERKGEKTMQKRGGWLKMHHRTRHVSRALDQATRSRGPQLENDERLECHWTCSVCFVKMTRQ